MAPSTAVSEVSSPVSTPTPILDRLVPLPKAPHRWPQRLKQFGIGGVIGVAASVPLIFGHVPTSIRAYVGQTFDPEAPLTFFAVLIVCTYVGIVIHETGHFVAGRLAGLQPNFVRVGPLQINAPFKLSWHWKQSTGMSGATSMLLRTGDVVNRKVLLVMLAGGPAANLFSAALMLTLQKFLPVPPVFGGSFVFAGLLLGLLNLLPLQNMAATSDGRRMMMLISKKGKGERWIFLIQLTSALAQGKEPEDLSPDILARVLTLKDNSQDTVTAYAIAYSVAFYKGSASEAARLLEVCLQYSPYTSLIMREALIADAVVFHGRKTRRADLAQQWLADLPEKPRVPGFRRRAEAAILEAQGHTSGALEKLRQAEAEVCTIGNRILKERMLKELMRWRIELESQVEQTTGNPN